MTSKVLTNKSNSFVPFPDLFPYAWVEKLELVYAEIKVNWSGGGCGEMITTDDVLRSAIKKTNEYFDKHDTASD